MVASNILSDKAIGAALLAAHAATIDLLAPLKFGGLIRGSLWS